MTSSMNKLVKAISAPPASKNTSLPETSIIKGSVVATSIAGGSTPTITVTINGDSTVQIPNVAFLDSYLPVVGDNVLLVKQKTDLWAIGTVAGTGANSGWIEPTLNSGTTQGAPAASGGPVYYRLSIDNGSLKVQLKGSVSFSGSPTVMWSMVAPFLPSVQRIFPVCTDAGVQRCTLDFATGHVAVPTGSPSWAYFDGAEYFLS